MNHIKSYSRKEDDNNVNFIITNMFLQNVLQQRLTTLQVSTYLIKLILSLEEEKLLDLDIKYFNIAKRKALTLYQKYNNSKLSSNEISKHGVP